METTIYRKCTMCRLYSEIAEHIIAGRPVLAEREYIERQNTIYVALHFPLSQYWGWQVTSKHLYEHTPSKVITSKDVSTTILYHQSIITDRCTPSHKSNTDITNNQQCIVIDVAISSDRNIVIKETEKILKYKCLLTEI